MTDAGVEISDEYLSQVTHELRGSLNAILGWAEFLRSTPCDDPARVRAAETIIRHARQQSWMIGELIDTWRLASGNLRSTVAPLDIDGLVQTAVEAVQPMAFARHVRVDLRRDGKPVGRLRGDSPRMTRAVTTLLANAVHFAPSGSVVDVSVGTAVGATALAVHDAGPSVARASLPFLFDRTRPRDPARRSPRGDFQLGLGFVRDVVIGHGGRIEAESDGEDAGVTFRITLPADGSLEATSPLAVFPNGSAQAGVPQQLVGLRVLLVDDEPDAREALEGILRHYGAMVRAASSAADAVAVLQQEPVDVLLADIAMPGADGYDLIKSIRALDSTVISHVPAVAVTAFTSEADRRRALDAGYQMHLSKPVDAPSLIATIAALGRAGAPPL